VLVTALSVGGELGANDPSANKCRVVPKGDATLLLGGVVEEAEGDRGDKESEVEAALSLPWLLVASTRSAL